tara:strand:+ start:105 stop:593 length:489 start_codon:yes stop_codon:yes gene_type:complete
MTIENTLIKSLTNFTMEMEEYSYSTRDYYEKDQLEYARLIFIKAIMDKAYYLVHGGNIPSEKFAYDKKQHALATVKRAKAGEIDFNSARQANCQSHAASAKHEVLDTLLKELQVYYTEWQGEPYLPYKADKSFLTGNVVAQEIKVPSDVAQELAAMEAELSS